MTEKINISNFFLLFLSVILLSCNKKEGTITIGIGTWPGFASAMVGMEKGFFDEKIKIRHIILDEANARHAAFRSGTLDIMISSLDVFAMEMVQGIDAEIILITDESWGSDGIVVRDEINTVADLIGKNIAFARATPSQFFLYNLLLENNIPFGNIRQTIVSDPTFAAQAFLGGSVDAAVTWEPFLSEVMERRQGKILATSRDMPNVIVDILVANRKFAENSELIKAFIDGWLKSVEYIQENPDEAKRIIAKGLNVPEEDIEGMMEGLIFADRQINIDFFNTQKINTVLESAFNFWQTQGIIDGNAQLRRDVINETARQHFSAIEK